MTKKILFILLVLSLRAWSAPIQWTSGVGGNDHWYDFITYSSTWDQAYIHVQSQSFMGQQGYLTTITSVTENNFIQANFSAYHGYWIGAYQTNKLAEPGGNWAWVTGEAWSYSNWASGEPNDANGDEDHAHFYSAGTWNDMHNGSASNGYFVEYNVPIPEISSLMLISLGIFCLAYFKINR